MKNWNNTCKISLITMILLLFVVGCSNNNEKINTNNQIEQENQEIIQTAQIEQDYDLVDFLSQDKDEIVKILGKPKDSYEGGLVYEGLSIYYDANSDIVSAFEIIDSDINYRINGITIGQTPNKIREVLGMADNEQIESDVDGNYFAMTYECEDNDKKYEINLSSKDFTSPVDGAYVTLIRESTPQYSVSELEEMLKAIWISEDLMHEENAYEFATAFNGSKIIVNSPWSKQSLEYQVVDQNIMEIETYNSITQEKGWGDRRYFEFSDDGNTLYLYKYSYEDEILTDTVEVYNKYSEIPE